MANTVDEVVFAIDIRARQRRSPVGADGGMIPYDHRVQYNKRFLEGAGPNRVSAAYSGRLTVTAGVPQDLDLRGGLLDLLTAQPVPFPIVMGLFLDVLSEELGQGVIVGGAGTPFSTWLADPGDGVKVGPAGFLHLWSPLNGYATTDATADKLRISAMDQTVQVALVLLGRGL